VVTPDGAMQFRDDISRDRFGRSVTAVKDRGLLLASTD
jgi:hypothetical protein